MVSMVIDVCVEVELRVFDCFDCLKMGDLKMCLMMEERKKIWRREWEEDVLNTRNHPELGRAVTRRGGAFHAQASKASTLAIAARAIVSIM